MKYLKMNKTTANNVSAIKKAHILTFSCKLKNQMIELRPATTKDLYLVKYWDTKQHVIDCAPDDEWN